MSINVIKLHNELVAEGLPIVGVSDNGEVSWLDAENVTSAELAEALAIVAAHDPYSYVDLRTGPDGYASAGTQLGMKYDDKINGTTLWVDHIVAVKAKFPKIQVIE